MIIAGSELLFKISESVSGNIAVKMRAKSVRKKDNACYVNVREIIICNFISL